MEYPAASGVANSSTELVNSSVEVPKVSAETTNFARYCRLLMDVGKDVLAALFKGSYKREKNKMWTEFCGESFLIDKFPDVASQRQLGKHMVENIRAGKCEEWDITLLASLLLITPGYIKDKPDAKKAAQTLRDERNSLAHSADLLARQSLNDQEFNVKWEVINGALDALMDQLLPAEKGAYRCKIEEISTEIFSESALDPLRKRLEQDIKDAIDMAGEALERSKNAASMSQVDKALEDKFEEFKIHFGQVDPCGVVKEWLVSISLQIYTAAIIEYGYDSPIALDAASEQEMQDMTEDEDVAMKKPHRAVFMREWRNRSWLRTKQLHSR
jgi:hypothetical protein